MLWFILQLGEMQRSRGYLNTSYVMVHPRVSLSTNFALIFKYILCYGSSHCHAAHFQLQAIFKYILCYGSSPAACLPLIANRFKYILCYGSSCRCTGLRRSELQFKYILCYGSSSPSNFSDILNIFKYILCYGSSCRGIWLTGRAYI